MNICFKYRQKLNYFKGFSTLALYGLVMVCCTVLYAGEGSYEFVIISSGQFKMGDQLSEGMANEKPVRNVYVSEYEVSKFPVSYEVWREVYRWAEKNGYSFENEGHGKSDNHPVVLISFNDILKWCNARSEMEGRKPVYLSDLDKDKIYRTGHKVLNNNHVNWEANGYRLPTEAEWEKAGRGGLSGKRFPWGNRISHEKANYDATLGFAYDESNPAGLHPEFKDGKRPYTNPVDEFEQNQFGIHDLVGNVWESCWDRYDSSYYADAPDKNPRGPRNGESRVVRGGSYEMPPFACRVTFRQDGGPVDGIGESVGFRVVRGSK